LTDSVFVSYASPDEAAVRLLERAMEDVPVEFVSLAPVAAADSWKSRYASFLEDVRCVVVLVGQTTHLSKPVDWEISQAREKRVPLLGLRLEGPHPQLPQGLAACEVTAFGTSEAKRRLTALVQSTYLADLAQMIREELSESDLPEGPVDDLFILYAVLLLAKGESVSRGDVHNAWSAWIMRTDPLHPAILPYSSLDPETAAQDEPFVRAIRRASRRLAGIDERE